jgi:hypothetical protein
MEKLVAKTQLEAAFSNSGKPVRNQLVSHKHIRGPPHNASWMDAPRHRLQHLQAMQNQAEAAV